MASQGHASKQQRHGGAVKQQESYDCLVSAASTCASRSHGVERASKPSCDAISCGINAASEPTRPLARSRMVSPRPFRHVRENQDFAGIDR
jgi:hypothetical protein